ncbi:MAG: hypothetical protein ACFFBD_07170 [Candidatus Hodarchaeota archaeon]
MNIIPDELPDSLSGIVLTEKGKNPPKEVLFITESKMAQALDDSVRLGIIRILSEGISDTQTIEEFNKETGERIIRQKTVIRNAMSVVEIVRMSKKSESAEKFTRNMVYHHLPKLIKAGYVIKYGTITKGKRTTDYYRRVAKSFVITGGVSLLGENYLQERATEEIESILKNFDLNIPDKDITELIDLRAKTQLMQDKWRPKIARMVRNDVTDPKIIEMYHWLLDVYSIGSEEFMKMNYRLRKILFSDKLEEE